MSPLVGSFLESRKGGWKSKVSGCHGPKGEGATRLRICTCISTSPGNLGAPKTNPRRAPTITKNYIRYILHQERERGVQQRQDRRHILLLHAFILSAPQRSSIACESVAYCINSRLISSLSSCFSSPRCTRQAIRQSVSHSLRVESTVDAPLRCPPHPMRPPSLTSSAPNKLPRIQDFQGRKSCCC
jgi:hypothetical protein